MMKIIFLACSALLVILALPAQAQVAPVEPMLTWHGTGYAPQYFEGRVLPVRDSVIRASFAVIIQGKILDLSRERIHWYLDDNFIDGGVGMKTLAFQVPLTAGGSIDLRAEAPGISDALKTVVIPVVSPEVVIRSPYPRDEFNTPSLKVEAVPYFFTGDPSRFTFDWSVNGQAPDFSDDPSKLTVNLAAGISRGFGIHLGVLVRNSLNSLEEARRTLKLTFNP